MSVRNVAASAGVNAVGLSVVTLVVTLAKDGLVPELVVSRSPVPPEYSCAATIGVVPVQVIARVPLAAMVFICASLMLSVPIVAAPSYTNVLPVAEQVLVVEVSLATVMTVR